ncbi:hypothetical protein [Longimicrobium terrae]|uniref:Uncharacterized protein n=1 Tax=Longimicrobium terrae TaxID=1639882 RepID=A0A841H257_9BACT|nr:hypothetical protein [Longimicrobium terrae]MBB4637619.1 hypothetical protein [Longimicrobium terrae]MBB6072016.1 hypothetical protein [Longimicrobium terrae]NNC29897.1 hypothetical protein [Longimicrobium terrae]
MEPTEALVAMTGIILGSLTVLIPITGITMRVALKPLMEALGRYREIQGQNDATLLMERRLALMEEQLHGMDRALRDLSDESDFRRQLESGSRQRLATPEIATAEAPRAESALANR